jgi:hypothetical protein
MYMSDDQYVDQTRRPTDKFFNNGVRVPHSENKKPYKIDDYGEMEYMAFPPWGFNIDWPQFPDSPVFDGEGTDPADDPYSGTDSDKPPEEWLPFLGCAFASPFTPASLETGEVATATLQPRDDRIVNTHLTGPCSLVVAPGACMSTLPFAARRANCTAVIRANATDGYQADPASGTVDCVLVLQTASGQSCSARVTVNSCDPDNAVIWDWVNSAETINKSSSVSVYVEGGYPPYTWSVSGTGFTLGNEVTIGVANSLIADADSCGSASITVTDACGFSASGAVRNVDEGQWEDVIPAECMFPGFQADTMSLGSSMDLELTLGQYKQRTVYRQFGYNYGCCIPEEPPCGIGYCPDYAPTPGQECLAPPSGKFCTQWAAAGGSGLNLDGPDFKCCWVITGDDSSYCINNYGKGEYGDVRSYYVFNLFLEEWVC